MILSFENHCSVEQQKVMANHLVNILGRIFSKNTINYKLRFKICGAVINDRNRHHIATMCSFEDKENSLINKQIQSWIIGF